MLFCCVYFFWRLFEQKVEQKIRVLLYLFFFFEKMICDSKKKMKPFQKKKRKIREPAKEKPH